MTLTVLGIETSCDETAASVVRLGKSGRPEILSNIVLSQIAQHQPFGGVVPEIAARAHVAMIDTVIERAMGEADVDFADLSAVAATAGPGLIGGLIVALMTGKAIAAVHDLPFLAINHLEGHALSVRLTQDIGFPYLLLLISGGHCQLLRVDGPGAYHRYGTTIDDAAGEAFDKTAKLLGLAQPGGPAIESAAEGGDPRAFRFPRPLLGRPGADFSFAGLKTAVAQTVRGLGHAPSGREVRDIAASFQAAIADCLADRTEAALRLFRAERGGEGATFVAAGGVAANLVLRARLEASATCAGFRFAVPPIHLCTDNGAMIAWAGIERLQAGLAGGMDAGPRPRWPLDEVRAGAGLPHATGAKGPKA
jgi:N6-L-threonylcarbamoyladenine synthase